MNRHTYCKSTLIFDIYTNITRYKYKLVSGVYFFFVCVYTFVCGVYIFCEWVYVRVRQTGMYTCTHVRFSHAADSLRECDIICVRVCLCVCVCVYVYMCVFVCVHILSADYSSNITLIAPIIHVTHTTRKIDQATRKQAATATATHSVLFATTCPQNKNNCEHPHRQPQPQYADQRTHNN